MEPRDFKLVAMEGEYAILRPVEATNADEDVFIALALLPAGADIGCTLRCEALQYTVLPE